MLGGLTYADEGRRVVVVDHNHGDMFYCTVEARVGGGYVIIWDVTNLPFGVVEGDVLEWLS